MTIFYQCDFCPEDERKPVQHDPNGQFATIISDMRDGNASVICEKCVRIAFEIVENNAIKYKNRQDKRE